MISQLLNTLNVSLDCIFTPRRSKYQQYALEHNFELTDGKDGRWYLYYNGHLEKVLKSELEASQYIYCKTNP